MQNQAYLTYQSVGIRSDAPGQAFCSSIARSDVGLPKPDQSRAAPARRSSAGVDRKAASRPTLACETAHRQERQVPRPSVVSPSRCSESHLAATTSRNGALAPCVSFFPTCAHVERHSGSRSRNLAIDYKVDATVTDTGV